MHHFMKRIASMVPLLLPFAAMAQTSGVSADTYINQSNAAVNFGTLGTMNVSTGNNALIQFDLSRLTALGLSASNIQQATLVFYLNKVLVSGGVDIALTGQSWSETGATYNNFNQGLVGAPFASNVATTATGQYVTVDVTSQVQAWITGAVTNNGIIIKPAVAQPSTSVVIDTKESTTTSHPAYIDVIVTSVGATGPSGPAGSAGAAGPSGPSGPAGPSGATGNTGSAGPSGPSGPSGATGSTGSQGAQGPSGPAGTNGNTVLNGTGAPTGGVDGDYYIRNDTNCLYGPKAGGIWPGTCVSLIGPSGPQGSAGAAGPSGPSGAAGAAGPSGPSGAAGPSGPSGAQGAAGPSGPSGATGNTGAAGPSGAQGTTGLTGATGPSGPSGPAGPISTTLDYYNAQFTNPGNTTTHFYNPGLLSSNTGGTAIQFSSANRLVAPKTCTMSQLSVAGFETTTGGAGNDQLTVTLNQNGSPTTLTCTLTVTNAVNGTGSCSDTSHTVAITAGDTLSLALSGETNATPVIILSSLLKCQ